MAGKNNSRLVDSWLWNKCTFNNKRHNTIAVQLLWLKESQWY